MAIAISFICTPPHLQKFLGGTKIALLTVSFWYFSFFANHFKSAVPRMFSFSLMVIHILVKYFLLLQMY